MVYLDSPLGIPPQKTILPWTRQVFEQKKRKKLRQKDTDLDLSENGPIFNSPNSKLPYQIIIIYGGFHKWGYPKMDGLKGKIPLKSMMIAGYPHIRKPSYISYSFIAVVGYPSFQQRHVRLSDCFIWIFQGLMSNGCTCTLLPIPHLLLLLRSLQVFFKMSVSLNLFL